MATFTAIQCKKQSASSMRGVIDYVEQEKKTCWGDALLVTGSNCVPQSAFIEMQMTKERFRKTGGTQFYHFVQSFSAEDNVTPRRSMPSAWNLRGSSSRISRLWSPPTWTPAICTTIWW